MSETGAGKKHCRDSLGAFRMTDIYVITGLIGHSALVWETASLISSREAEAVDKLL